MFVLSPFPGRLDGLVLAVFLAPFDFLMTPAAQTLVGDGCDLGTLLTVLVVSKRKRVAVLGRTLLAISTTQAHVHGLGCGRQAKDGHTSTKKSPSLDVADGPKLVHARTALSVQFKTGSCCNAG